VVRGLGGLVFYTTPGVEDPTFGNFKTEEDYLKSMETIEYYPQVQHLFLPPL
jgi:hypothetical protein